MRYGPDPHSIYPNEKIKSVYYFKNVIARPNIIVGDYTYYDDISELIGKARQGYAN
jgi:virginiamycin A acetyltransferase